MDHLLESSVMDGIRLACFSSDLGLDHLLVDGFCVPMATYGHAVGLFKLLLARVGKGN